MFNLLLHICCAPDLTAPFERLKDDYNISAFFYNPNIFLEEYNKRLSEFINLNKKLNLKFKIGRYDSLGWHKSIKGLEKEKEGGKRCLACFKFRLEKTAQTAKENKFDFFSTVLTISPHKDAEIINAIGENLAKEYQIDFLKFDFKKQEGFKRSLALSKEYQLYRQNFCGCIYSLRR